MYQGLIGAWQAKRVGKKGQLLDQGILPNKSRYEINCSAFVESRNTYASSNGSNLGIDNWVAYHAREDL